jgi:hypothetical protein
MPIIDTPSGLTVEQAIERTLGRLQGARRVEQNKLNGIVADENDTTIAATYSQTWGRGTVVEIERELMYVWASSGTSASVQRGFRGTTAGAHADGTIMRINPTFARQDVFDALLAELRSLNGTGLRAFSTIEISYADGTMVYDLDGLGGSEVTGIHDARWEDSDGDAGTHRAQYRFLRDLDTDDFASGYGIMILAGGEGGKAIRVTAVIQFSDFTAEGDVLGTACTLPSYCEDALISGAAYRLAISPEGRRVQLDAQPARSQDEVPVTGNSRFHEQLYQMREREIARALAQQYRMRPPRVKA